MPVPVFSLASDIATQTRAEAATGANPVASALQDDEMYQRLSDLNAEGVNYPNEIGMKGWGFLDKETIISTIASTTLNGAILSGATSLILTSATGWDDPASADIAAGYIKTGDDIFDFFSYGELASTTLSSAEGIQMGHASGEEVHKIYALPSDYGYPRAMFRESRTLEWYSQEQSKRQVPRAPFYMVKIMEVTISGTIYRKAFVVFPEDIGALTWVFRYQRQATVIDAGTDRVDMPNGHGRRFLIEGLKSYIYHNEGETNDELKSRELSRFHLAKLADEWSTETQESDQSLRFDDAD